MATVPLETITIREAYPDQFESTLKVENPGEAFKIAHAINGHHFVPRCSFSDERPNELVITWVPQPYQMDLYDSDGNAIG